jgi:hypothetical protein
MPGDKKKTSDGPDKAAIVQVAGSVRASITKLLGLIPESDTKNTAHLEDANKAIGVCIEDYEID